MTRKLQDTEAMATGNIILEGLMFIFSQVFLTIGVTITKVAMILGTNWPSIVVAIT